MKRLNLSININASREKVWRTIIGEETYPEWTAVFALGSHFKGSWEKGSKILFLAPNQEGEMEGMASIIEENKPCEFISIKHIGYVNNGIEEINGPDVEKWVPFYENYSLKEKDIGSEFILDMEITDEYYDYFVDTWPKALSKLKEICERDGR